MSDNLEQIMVNEIIEVLQANYDEQQSQKMSAYMKNMFVFAGIAKQELKKLTDPIIKKYSKNPLDWQIIFDLWNNEYRESQYVALEYLTKHQKQLKPEDIDNLKHLIINKSWWETVDTIDSFVGQIVLQDGKLKETILQWATSDNIWLRRVAIDFQQKFKKETDTQLLEKIILLNLGSDEFFINKAIGWSLRDYSKVNPDWVRNFIEQNKDKLSNLSIKEASKYL